ncbi:MULTISPECIES: TonB-dependent receptor [Comamonas]|uniref:TonB-dependent receptor n=1 Tax=Comamonas TaxID=283 RepID=UPI000552FC35|nr:MULTISPECIES: TonB-dependent receptor [Comamonas]TFF55686.1 TonB-dependent receptor [Comamonas sp. A23]
MKLCLHRKLPSRAGAVVLSTLMAPAGVFAQGVSGSEEETATLDVVVVSGEKVRRELKDTASSVSVKSGKDIEKEESGNASVHEVLHDVPNVVYTDTVGAPIIRGQDTQGPNNGQNVFWGGTVPRATINLDGHYLNYNEMFFGATSVWDVESIEVFRGPQTTSQGANAIAGAIIVNTKDPSFKPEAAYQLEAGNYNSHRASIAVSGPVGEELAARLAVDYAGRDTFIDYNNPRFQQGQANQDFRALNARLKLLWLPSSIPGLEAKFTYSHNDSNRPTQEAASAPFGALKHWTTTMPSWKQKTDTGILDLSYELSNGLRLVNQAQYSRSSVQRYTGISGEGDADIRQNNFSNEFRALVGNEKDRLSGFGGIYYARTNTDESLLLRGLSAFDDTKKNLGIFGELNLRLTDRWTLSSGLRYQQDEVVRNGSSVLAPTPLGYTKTFSALLPKVSLAYAATPRWTVGALVSRGYNPGGVSLNLTSRQWAYFKKESIWNYELFSRTSLFDDRLMLNTNLFYMDMRDAQYNIPVVISPGVAQSYTINAEKAHAYGFELGADYRALDNLRIKAGAGVLRTRIEEMSSNPGYEHNRFARSPGYTVSVGVSWDATPRFNVSAQVRHLDGYYSDTANTRAYVVGSNTITDLRMSYAYNAHVQLYGYIKNVFDRRAPTYLQQNRGIGGIEASMTAPRMIGVGVRGTF